MPSLRFGIMIAMEWSYLRRFRGLFKAVAINVEAGGRHWKQSRLRQRGTAPAGEGRLVERRVLAATPDYLRSRAGAQGSGPDPRRSTILLIGGNKAGDDRFYRRHVPLADRLYDEHLQELRKEGLIE